MVRAGWPEAVRAVDGRAVSAHEHASTQARAAAYFLPTSAWCLARA